MNFAILRRMLTYNFKVLNQLNHNYLVIIINLFSILLKYIEKFMNLNMQIDCTASEY